MIYKLPTPDAPLRMYNADCLTVMRDLPSESFDMCLTDPPYGIGFSLLQRENNTEGFEKILNDERPFVWWLFDAARLLKEGGCLVCFCRWDVAEAFRLAIGWAGLEVKQQLIWDKGNWSMGDLEGAPGTQHEMMWFAVKGRFRLPGKRPSSIYPFARVSADKMIHPNEKPPALLRKLLHDYTRQGDAVLEPFGGSGSTGMTCYSEGRLCFMTELDPGHYANQKKRFAALTDPQKMGRKPVFAAPAKRADAPLFGSADE